MKSDERTHTCTHTTQSTQMYGKTKKWKCARFNHKHLQKQKLTHTLASWTWLDVAVIPTGAVAGRNLRVLSLLVSVSPPRYPHSDLSVSHQLPVPDEEHVVFHHKAPGPGTYGHRRLPYWRWNEFNSSLFWNPYFSLQVRGSMSRWGNRLVMSPELSSCSVKCRQEEMNGGKAMSLCWNKTN